MNYLRDKIFKSIRSYRITSGQEWIFEQRRRFFFASDEHEKESFNEELDKLVSEGVFEQKDDSLYLTQYGEDVVYEGMDNCRERIIDYLSKYRYKAGSIISFQQMFAIKNTLNAIEEKHLQSAIDSLVSEGILSRDRELLVLTDVGEKLLKNICKSKRY